MSARRKPVATKSTRAHSTARSPAQAGLKQEFDLDQLYSQPIAATRTGALFGAFPYPTKISPEAIALYIAAHTRPGDTVFDGFGGSGTTGLAAILCDRPSAALKAEATRLGLNVQWGPRKAVVYELSTLGAFIGRTLTNPPDPESFRKAAERLIASEEEASAWMYEARDPDGKLGEMRHIVWTDHIKCPKCRKTTTVWDAYVSLRPAKISSAFTCPSCNHAAGADDPERTTITSLDKVLGEKRTTRRRSPARIYGATGKKRWSRAATAADLALIKKIEAEPLVTATPITEIPWGDLYRKGYHQGITHLHHFYTRRNLIVFARLWERANKHQGALRDALRFWLLSYNAAHATLMTRVVAKTNQPDLVVTSAQPGVLYVSGLPVEKNLFAGLRRKLTTISQAFGLVHGSASRVEVIQGSSCAVDIASGTIDYVFTDPPFGGNIPYAELNFINEAWLGKLTDRSDEAIISANQDKGVGDYQELLTQAFTEARRVLKATGRATMVFHSSTAEVWNALQSAYQDAGFDVITTSVLDKVQGSFKQVTTEGAVRGDPVLLLGPRAAAPLQARTDNVWSVARSLQKAASLAKDPAEKTAQRLYSRLVNHFLSLQQQVPLDADAFYSWYTEQSFAGALHGAAE